MSSVQANLPIPTTLLIGGEVALRYQHELEGASIPTGVVETGGEAVAAVREGGYQAVIVPAVLPDMSSYDFCMSLLRHVQGVFVVLYGTMDPRYVGALVQTGLVAHVSGSDDESLAHLILSRFGFTPPAPVSPSRPTTPTSGSTPPFGGLPIGMRSSAAPSQGAADDLKARVSQLEEDLGLTESELEDVRARLAETEREAAQGRTALKDAEQRLAKATREAAEMRATLESAQKTAERARMERDGLRALVDSLEEDRGDVEKRLSAFDELVKEKAGLEQMISELSRKLAEKTTEAAEGQTLSATGSIADAIKNLVPHTWSVVQAAEWLQANDAPEEHVRSLRVAIRSVEALIDEARSRGLLDG